MKAMILAAGFGSRMQQLTKTMPKPLLEVGGSTLIERSIISLMNSGVDKFVINVSYLGDQIKSALSSLKVPGIIVIDEPFPYGTGGALINARDFLGNEPFILSSADILFNPDLTQLPPSTDVAHLIATENPEHNKEGDFSLREGAVFIKDGVNDYTYSGVALLNPKILDEHVTRKFPFDLWNTILRPLIEKSEVTAHVDNAFWIDVGTPDRLKLARTVLKDENYQL